jgi:threonine aldolase
MVFVDLAPGKAPGAVERLKARGVLCTGLYRMRFVTHLDVSHDDIERAIAVLRETL